MNTYHIQFVSYSTLEVQASSREEAIEKANEAGNMMSDYLTENSSGWEVDTDVVAESE